MSATTPRPPAVTVFAILNLGFGALGLIFSLVNLASLLTAGPGPASPSAEITRGREILFSWEIFAGITGAAAAGALLVSGIGMLSLRGWAWKLSLAYAVFMLASGAVSLLLRGVVFREPVLEAARQAGDPGLSGGLFLGLAGQSCGMVYPLALLLFLLRAEIRAIFRAQAPPPASGPPAAPPS